MPDSTERLSNGNGTHLAALDGMRGLAVLLVFVLHYGGGAQSHNFLVRSVGLAVQIGWCGVTLFFLLSGYLITGILLTNLGESHWARNFYARRVLRIFPLYYAAILILILAGAWQSALLQTLKTAGVLAIFCQNLPIFPLPDHVAAPVFHLSSVAVEEQFYVLWPAILFFCRRHHLVAIAGCCGAFFASFAFRIFVVHYVANPEAYMMTLMARGGELAIGCLLALLQRRARWSTVQRIAPFACACFFCMFLLASKANGSFQLRSSVEWEFGLPAITLCLAGLLVIALGQGIVARFASTGWLRRLGQISYGVYVLHILMLHLVNLAAFRVAGSHTGNFYEALRFVIAATATLIVSSLSFRYLERPFLKLKRFFPMDRQLHTG